ncbi:MAG: CYTH domain-containing protein [Thermoanaerobaculia bacterium]|nr:CYTH domain-containing protein [Thermoanaerobaculia bacterium]
MAQEIERKFLVAGASWKDGATGTLVRQGYLSSVKERTVRVRVAGGKAFLTIKGVNRGVTRTEFEYRIPVDEAAAMLDALCERPLIEKTRWVVPFEGFTWEVDEFHGENAGLVVAEVELPTAGTTPALPPWVREEVTSDPRYYNANLAKKPFTAW